LVFVFTGAYDSFQWMRFGGMPRDVADAIQDFLPVIAYKAACALYRAAKLSIANLDTRRAKFPVRLVLGIYCASFPNAVLKNQFAFWAFGISLIFSRLNGAAQLASLFCPECAARSICVTHHSSFKFVPLPILWFNSTIHSRDMPLLSPQIVWE